MKKLFTITAFLLLIVTFLQAADGFKGRPITTNVWMPTGYTLHDCEFMIGFGSIAYGITEEAQLETNVLLDLLTLFNAGIKVNVLNDENGSLAVGAQYLHFNVNTFNLYNYSDDNKFIIDLISPYIGFTSILDEDWKVHIGGNYSYLMSDISIDSIEVSGFFSGTSVSAGLEYSLSNKTKFLGDFSYDLTFKSIKPGGAVLWGWKTFRLKIGGGVIIHKSSLTFVPVIDMWWRF